MNADRLLELLDLAKEDYEKNKVLEHVKAVATALQKALQTPDITSEEQLRDAFKAMKDALQPSFSNVAPPAMFVDLKHTGAHEYLGLGLAQTVERIIQGHGIARANAVAEMDKLHASVGEFSKRVRRCSEILHGFNITSSRLKSNECEVGVVIPRQLVGSNLSDLAAKSQDFDKLIKLCQEISGEATVGGKIRSIGSSEFQIFVESGYQTAALIAATISFSLAAYKAVLEIIELHKKLRDTGLPEEASTKITEHAQAKMKAQIDEAAETIIRDRCKADNDERKNELRNNLSIHIKSMVDGIGNGMLVQVRVEAPEPPQAEPEQRGGDPSDEGSAELRRLEREQYDKAIAEIERLNLDGSQLARVEDINRPLRYLKGGTEPAEASSAETTEPDPNQQA